MIGFSRGETSRHFAAILKLGDDHYLLTAPSLGTMEEQERNVALVQKIMRELVDQTWVILPPGAMLSKL